MGTGKAKMEGNPDANIATIGNYVFDKTLGEGNFAKVKLAKHKLTGQEVAIKIIDKMSLDDKMLSKLYREVKILKLLHHPNIVKLYEVLETKHTIFLVMEYVSGGELYDYLVVHGRMKEKEARAKFRQIINAVSYCHKKRVIHRDLKAENLLVDANLNIKIADFGFSNQFDPDGKLDTFCGSPPYAAPELFQGKRYTGPEVDVWSCGVILYVLTTGCLPFDGNNLQEMRESVTRGKYRIPFYLSEGCEKLLRKFLVRDPMKRPSLDILIDDEWLNEGYDAPPISFDVKEELTGEDPLVLNIMESKFGVPKYDIIKGLHDNEYSENLAIYFLLYDEKIKNGDAAVAKIAEAMSIKAPVQQATPQPEQKHGAPVPAIEPIAEETSVEELKKPKEAIPAAQAPYVSRRRASISQEPKLPPPAPSSGASKKDTENIPANAAIPQVATRVNVVNTPAKRQRRATVTGNSDRPQFDPVASGEQQKEAKPKEKKPSAGTPAVEPTNASPANEEKIEVVSRAAPVPGNRNRRFSIAVTTEQYVPSIPESVVPSLKIEGDSKEKQPEKKKSSIIGFLKFGRKSGDEASNGAADKPNKEEKSVLQDNTDLKPRSLRFTFASNTTSSKSPDHMIQEVITAATKHGYKFRLVHNFLIECVASPPNNLPGAEHVKIEIEVCKLPRLTRLHGFRFQRISGASADYKTVCEKLLASIQL